MRQCTSLDVSAFIETARGKLREEGIVSLSIENDFALFQELAGKEVVSRRQFDPVAFDLLSERGIWIRGQDAVGRTVMLQAMREDDLGSCNLSKFLQHMLPRVGEGHPVADSVCRLADEIKGRVVCHGAGWIAPEYRGGQCGPWAFRMGQAIALLEFNYNWVYGFVAKKTAERGLAYRQGFVHMQPYALEWTKEPKYPPFYALAANTRQDTLDMIRTGHQRYVRDEAKQKGGRLEVVG